MLLGPRRRPRDTRLCGTLLQHEPVEMSRIEPVHRGPAVEPVAHKRRNALLTRETNEARNEAVITVAMDRGMIRWIENVCSRPPGRRTVFSLHRSGRRKWLHPCRLTVRSFPAQKRFQYASS